MGEAKRALSRMSPAEKQLFAEGYVSSVMDKVNRTPDRANVIRQIWGNAKVREQMEVALGPAKAKEFEAFMGVETVMDEARKSLGNSTTARQLVELGLAGTAGGASGLYTGDPITGLTIAALTYGGRRGANAANQGVAKSIASLLTSNDPTKFRRGVQAVTRSRQHMASLRSFIASGMAVSGGQQGAEQSRRKSAPEPASFNLNDSQPQRGPNALMPPPNVGNALAARPYGNALMH